MSGWWRVRARRASRATKSARSGWMGRDGLPVAQATVDALRTTLIATGDEVARETAAQTSAKRPAPSRGPLGKRDASEGEGVAGM